MLSYMTDDYIPYNGVILIEIGGRDPLPPNFVLFAVAKLKYLSVGFLSVNSFEDSKMFENIIL